MMRGQSMALLAIVTLAAAGCAQTPDAPRAYAPQPSGKAAPTPAAATAPAATNVAATDPDRVICRKDEATGSRLRSTNICKTAREWEQIRDDARRATDAMEKQKGTASRLPIGGG